MRSWQANDKAGDGTPSRLRAASLSASLSSRHWRRWEWRDCRTGNPSQTSPTWQKRRKDHCGSSSGDKLLRHNLGPDQPQPGHLGKRVCCKTWNTQWTQNTTLMMCLSCTKSVFVNSCHCLRSQLTLWSKLNEIWHFFVITHACQRSQWALKFTQGWRVVPTFDQISYTKCHPLIFWQEIHFSTNLFDYVGKCVWCNRFKTIS